MTFIDENKGIDILDWIYKIIRYELIIRGLYYEGKEDEYLAVVYLTLFKRISKYYTDIGEGYEPLLGYISDTVHGVVRDQLDKEKRLRRYITKKAGIIYYHQRKRTGYPRHLGLTPKLSISAEKSYLNIVFYEKIYKALSTLSPKQRKAFLDIVIHGKLGKEIAVEMECTEQNVSKLKYKAIKNLKKKLGQDFYHEYYRLVA